MMKSSLHKLRIAIPIIIASYLSGCVSDQISPQETVVPDTVSFALDVVPIFDASCNIQGCHNANGIPPDLTASNAWVNLIFFNYVDTLSSENSLLWQKINGGSMEQYTTEQDRAIILQWIEQDAPDN